MFILQAHRIQKQYGERTVLDFESFQVYEGDKIGIVGANGTGKTTLLGILSGEISPDSGVVDRRCEAAFIRQMAKGDGALSGGENAKRQIERETGKSGQIVFADEPTANLDADGVAWVREKLRRASTVLLVSHDRDLLNDICTTIVEIRDGGLHTYTGNYDAYERAVREAKARQEAEYALYQRKKAQLEEAVRRKEGNVSRQRQKKRRDYVKNLSEARLAIGKRRASAKKQEGQGKVLEKRLERLEKVEKVKAPPRVRLDFSLTRPPGNKLVVSAEHVTFAYGDHVVLDGASFTVKNGAKVAVTGKNGVGKTTLLRLILEGYPGIRTAPKLRPGVLCQQFENLDAERSVLDNVLSTSVQDEATVRNVLAGLLFRRDEVYKQVSVLSGGEKMRVSLAKLVTSDCNALFLDEPTNYLDVRALEAVEQILKEYPGTLIVVSHDRVFLQSVTREELRIENGKIVPVAAVPSGLSDSRRTLLEVRRMQLLARISSAPMEEKPILEAQYSEISRQLEAGDNPT